jgi:hypothetical protein
MRNLNSDAHVLPPFAPGNGGVRIVVNIGGHANTHINFWCTGKCNLLGALRRVALARLNPGETDCRSRMPASFDRERVVRI